MVYYILLLVHFVLKSMSRRERKHKIFFSETFRCHNLRYLEPFLFFKYDTLTFFFLKINHNKINKSVK